jgi:hypothetical protein
MTNFTMVGGPIAGKRLAWQSIQPTSTASPGSTRVGRRAEQRREAEGPRWNDQAQPARRGENGPTFRHGPALAGLQQPGALWPSRLAAGQGGRLNDRL